VLSSNPVQQLHLCLKAEATMLLFPIVYIFGNNCSVLYIYQDVSRLELDFSAHVEPGKVYLNVSLSWHRTFCLAWDKELYFV